MSCMSQNFRLFHVSNLSVRNFRIFLLMYTGSVPPDPPAARGAGLSRRRAASVGIRHCARRGGDWTPSSVRASGGTRYYMHSLPYSPLRSRRLSPSAQTRPETLPAVLPWESGDAPPPCRQRWQCQLHKGGSPAVDVGPGYWLAADHPFPHCQHWKMTEDGPPRGRDIALRVHCPPPALSVCRLFRV